MNRDRVALLVTSSALLVSWLSTPASPTPESPPAQQAVVPSPARDATMELAFDVARETERLRQRVAAAPGPRRGGRDPFAFALPPKAAPRQEPRARPVEIGVAVSEMPVAPAPRPALRLIGIAERQSVDGVVRSAILSGPSDVYIVSAGDQVVGRFVVSGIDAAAVDLVDSVTQAPLRLVLPN